MGCLNCRLPGRLDACPGGPMADGGIFAPTPKSLKFERRVGKRHKHTIEAGRGPGERLPPMESSRGGLVAV